MDCSKSPQEGWSFPIYHLRFPRGDLCFWSAFGQGNHGFLAFSKIFLFGFQVVYQVLWSSVRRTRRFQIVWCSDRTLVVRHHNEPFLSDWGDQVRPGHIPKEESSRSWLMKQDKTHHWRQATANEVGRFRLTSLELTSSDRIWTWPDVIRDPEVSFLAFSVSICRSCFRYDERCVQVELLVVLTL